MHATRGSAPAERLLSLYRGANMATKHTKAKSGTRKSVAKISALPPLDKYDPRVKALAQD